jgi:hypothetical protein
MIKTRVLARESLNDWDTILVVHPELLLSNNQSERALRHWVIARRIGMGTRAPPRAPVPSPCSPALSRPAASAAFHPGLTWPRPSANDARVCRHLSCPRPWPRSRPDSANIPAVRTGGLNGCGRSARERSRSRSLKPLPQSVPIARQLHGIALYRYSWGSHRPHLAS